MIDWLEKIEKKIRSSLQIQLLLLFALGAYFISISQKTAILTLLIFLFILYFFVQTKTRQLREITNAAKQIAKGDFQYRIFPNSMDEIGQLAEQINEMAGQLQEKIEAERKNEQLKNDLITNISHDLRTPLTSIIGYLRLLQDQAIELTEENQKYLSLVYQKSNHLQELIDRLFEFTKYTHHDVVLEQEKINLNRLLAQLVDEAYPMISESGCKLIERYHPTPCYVKGDPSMLARMMENLLQNAIRYADEPKEITIRIWEDEKNVWTSFCNPAPAITPEQASLLFEKFYRLDTARSSKGSGIGLAIVKSIAELHQGRVQAAVKQGAITFTVQLPKYE